MFVVTRGDAIGGVQIHIRDIATALVKSGHAVRVVTGRRGIFTDALRRVGVDEVECRSLQREIDPRQDARAVACLRREIAAFGPDVVSTHSSKAGILGRLACAVGGPPCIFTAHGWAFTEGVPARRRRVYREIERRLAPLAARIICVSEHDRQIAIAAGISRQKVVSIHNGMPDVAPALRADPGGAAPVRVVMIARFSDQKDHATLLRAAAGVEGCLVDFIGDGPTQPAVRALAGELGIDDRVRFLGHRDDVAEVLARSHLFALISKWEGFPRSTLEAMRAGLPAIVSDVGGSAEAIAEHETGFVVPRGDVAAIGERLRRLVGDATLRQRMGKAARHRYETFFTFERMLDETMAVYRSVASRPRSGSPMAASSAERPG